MSSDDVKDQVLRALSRPRALVERLGLKPEQASDSYALVCCPVHGDRRASCSVYRKNGTVNVYCRGCGWRSNALGLVAAVNGLDPRNDFREVLATACQLAGMLHEADELRAGKKAHVRKTLPAPEPDPPTEYPPKAEVRVFWSACIPVTEDSEVSGLLMGRGIDPVAVARMGLGAALHPLTHQSSIPRWARFKGRLPVSRRWTESGHRLVVPVFDHAGEMRSVRAWLVNGDERLPKRVPPTGYRASGLVLANTRAQRWLRGDARPSQIVITEGEPDFLARSVAFPNEAAVGIGSGSWTQDFAERVPMGSEVALMTHIDPAGDRYADEIAKTVSHRAQVTRWTVGGEAA